MNTLKASLLFFVFAVIALFAVNCNLRQEVHTLEKTIENRDSIISNQSEYIIQLTYQHEDDDALWEEEQP